MQKKSEWKSRPPRQQFLFPDKLYLLPSRRTFPALRLPSESSSLTLLFLYSATTTLYFFSFFLSSTNYRPAGGVKLSNRLRGEFFYGGRRIAVINVGTGMFYILHPNQTIECQVWLLMEEKKCPDPPNNWLTRYLSSHHHPSNPIATEKSRTASLRLDYLYMYLSNTILSKRFSRESYSTSPTYAGTRVCVRRKWRQAQAHRGRSFLPIDCHDGHVSEKYLPRVRLFNFFFLSLNMNLTFFRYYDARR